MKEIAKRLGIRVISENTGNERGFNIYHLNDYVWHSGYYYGKLNGVWVKVKYESPGKLIKHPLKGKMRIYYELGDFYMYSSSEVIGSNFKPSKVSVSIVKKLPNEVLVEALR